MTRATKRVQQALTQVLRRPPAPGPDWSWCEACEGWEDRPATRPTPNVDSGMGTASGELSASTGSPVVISPRGRSG